jgi:hypothetical protein
VDVQEVRKLDAYLKKLFGNPNVRVVPKTYDTAEIFVGEDDVGELKFDNDKIRVVTRPKKTDSFEAYLGDEFIGVLFFENEKGRKSYIFEIPILDIDLVDAEA